MSAPLAVSHSNMICTIARSIALRARETFGLALHRPPIELPDIGVSMWWPRRLADDDGHRWLRERLVSAKIFPPPASRKRAASPKG